ncbi:MAG: STAS domain-containing protein [Planctomycetes bacterium]|nr:STAS domain-containing protein [Planctomycetota bacterium]
MAEEEIIEIEYSGNCAVVVFKAASLSSSKQISELSDTLRDFVEEQKPTKMIFDFEAVKFFSSQVLGILLDMRKRLKEFDGKIVISAIDPQLYRVFRITNLDKIFEFFPDRNTAIEATEKK